MKKPQFIAIVVGLLLISILYFFVPRSKKKETTPSSEVAVNEGVTSKTILEGAKTSLTADQKISLLSIENQLNTSKKLQDSIRTVSYTHLTLPTILRV